MSSPGNGETPKARRGRATSLACDHCSLTFRRREHLSRHLDRHSGARPHQCLLCSRSFPRRDTLKRHMTTHGATAVAQWTQQNGASHRHACAACAKAKQKCDGDGLVDCSNCASRDRICVYRDDSSRTSQPPGDGGIEEAETLVPDSDVRTPITGAIVGDDTVLLDSTSRPAGQADIAIPEQSAAGQHPELADMLTLPFDTTWNAFPLMPQLIFPYSPMLPFEADELSVFTFGNGVPDGAPALDRHVVNNNQLNPITPSARHVEVECQQDEAPIDDEDALAAEHLPHVMQVPAETHARIISFIRNDLPGGEADALIISFPPLRHLDVYVQLYFEHYQPRVPLLHIPTFRTSPASWQLVLAVACVGCQYSVAHHKPKHLALFHRLSMHMLQRDVRNPVADTLADMQSLLLFHHALWRSDKKVDLIHVQLYRNVLVTLCRQMLSQDGSVLRGEPQPEQTNDPWIQWVQGEARRRMLYFTWMTECLHSVFNMIPPLMSTHELRVSLPYHEAYWRADHQQWQRLPPPQAQLPLCSVLARLGREDRIPESLGASARFTLLLSASVQYTASEQIRRSMMLHSASDNVADSDNDAGSLEHLQRTAIVALLRDGSAQTLSPDDASSIMCDYAIMSRVLRILDFTPAHLLYPATQFQTTESGANRARSELSEVFSMNIGRARQSLLEAAQLFRYFRAMHALSHNDPLCLVICVVYISAYIEHVASPKLSLNGHGSSPQSIRIIRLDQAISDEDTEDWLRLRCNCRLHLVGIGFLDADRSCARLYKEASRIMANSASTSKLAASLSIMFASQAVGNAPRFEDDR